jgi:peptidoglycan hydrolase-like protein with peptidoglycan-binding domain
MVIPMPVLYRLAAVSFTLMLMASPARAQQQDSVPESALRGPSFSMPPAGNAPESTSPVEHDAVRAAYIQGLQRALPSHGYHPGPVSGRLDRQTEQAILAYQHDAGIRWDGTDTLSLQGTLDSVSFARPAIYARPEKPVPLADAGGDTVHFVQGRLKAKGYELDQNGTLDPHTVNAIKAFQASNGLPRDGKIDGNLIDLLRQ